MIQRFDLGEAIPHSGDYWSTMAKSKDGDYVEYDDHRAAVRELADVLQDLLAMCERQADFNDDGDGRMLERARAAIAKHQEGEG